MRALKIRAGRRLALGRPASAEELETAGIARRLAGRWAISRLEVSSILAPGYDRDQEADASELFAEIGGFADARALGRALRGHVAQRTVLRGDGRQVVVFDRHAALERLTNQRPATRMPPPVVRSMATEPRVAERTHFGPIALRAPTIRQGIASRDAAWLLAESERALRQRVKSLPPERRAAPGEVPLWLLEETLSTHEDYEAFVLVAALIDGRLVITADLDRTKAILAATEKTEWAR